jgi:hypothetical protein
MVKMVSHVKCSDTNHTILHCNATLRSNMHAQARNIMHGPEELHSLAFPPQIGNLYESSISPVLGRWFIVAHN